jgi:hypothetical protein
VLVKFVSVYSVWGIGDNKIHGIVRNKFGRPADTIAIVECAVVKDDGFHGQGIFCY